jgi:hypothetical protein
MLTTDWSHLRYGSNIGVHISGSYVISDLTTSNRAVIELLIQERFRIREIFGELLLFSYKNLTGKHVLVAYCIHVSSNSCHVNNLI